ncbi:MAG: hypothetical protein Fur0037_13400 [Planctomycetota bacterium]
MRLRIHVRFGWMAAAAATSILLAACSAPPPPLRPTRPPAGEIVLSADWVLGQVRADADLEDEDLRGVRLGAARLRRAWIQLGLGRPERGIELASEVLYDQERPSPPEEALARYIRAECYEAMGDPGRGEYDRKEAARLALDPALQKRLEDQQARSQRRTAAEALHIEPRAEWHPLRTIGQRLDPMGRIFRITVHHSAMPFRDTSPDRCAEEIRMIQRAHMNSPDRHYGDIGYHFLIDPAGRVWEGRDLRYQGAHARADNNRGNIGICLLGNFVRGSGGQSPTAPQIASLERLLEALCRRYRIGVDEILGHRDFVTTECPGPRLAALLPGIRDRIAARIRESSRNLASSD